MMGLPGSGKTTFAKELERKIGTHKTLYIDMDNLPSIYEYYYTDGADLYELLKMNVEQIQRSHTINNIIIDGLILTNDDIIKVINAVSFYVKELVVKIYHWNEDRELCLKNDGGRRELSSSTTILNAKYEKVDTDYICSKFDDNTISSVKEIIKKVVLKEGWERYFRHSTIANEVNDDFKIRSSRWCAGGTCGSCFHEGLSQITADERPEFYELDDLLEEICPTITFIHYKKLIKECVEIESNYERDFYGGGCTYNNWVCDLKLLYATLKDLDYIIEI
jgi:hypothetical protein